MEIITSAQYHQQHIESRKQYEVVYNTEGYDRIVKYSDLASAYIGVIARGIANHRSDCLIIQRFQSCDRYLNTTRTL
ncbi:MULTISPECIES: hypothetical protein [unclassified Nostoc]|nr:hypothetical protein [Nostoc sp. S13]MDF5735065.1 hypothetical protein [Nostoc sp. S13]